MSRERLFDLIERHEGRRLKPYLCPSGKLTIGVGRNLTDKGISDIEATMLRNNDINDAFLDITSIFNLTPTNINDARLSALISMHIQLGPGGFRSFNKMIKAIKEEDWSTAAKEALDSVWHTQTPARAEEIGEMLRSGEWSK